MNTAHLLRLPGFYPREEQVELVFRRKEATPLRFEVEGKTSRIKLVSKESPLQPLTFCRGQRHAGPPLIQGAHCSSGIVVHEVRNLRIETA